MIAGSGGPVRAGGGGGGRGMREDVNSIINT